MENPKRPTKEDIKETYILYEEIIRDIINIILKNLSIDDLTQNLKEGVDELFNDHAFISPYENFALIVPMLCYRISVIIYKLLRYTSTSYVSGNENAMSDLISRVLDFKSKITPDNHTRLNQIVYSDDIPYNSVRNKRIFEHLFSSGFNTGIFFIIWGILSIDESNPLTLELYLQMYASTDFKFLDTVELLFGRDNKSQKFNMQKDYPLITRNPSKIFRLSETTVGCPATFKTDGEQSIISILLNYLRPIILEVAEYIVNLNQDKKIRDFEIGAIKRVLEYQKIKQAFYDELKEHITDNNDVAILKIINHLTKINTFDEYINYVKNILTINITEELNAYLTEIFNIHKEFRKKYYENNGELKEER